MLIVLEGLDGAGKSTQVKLLKEYLEQKNLKLKYLHFPRYDAPIYGDLISKYLRGDFGSIEQVHPQIVALLFALDRKEAAADIRRWLEEGYTVLLDRYVYSNIAYQCSKILEHPIFGAELKEERAEELREWIFKTEYEDYNIPRPTVNLFLDVPIEFVNERLCSSREGDDNRDYLNGKGDIHELDIKFQVNVRAFYLRQTKLDKDFMRVNCMDNMGKMLEPSAIFSNIKQLVDKFI